MKWLWEKEDNVYRLTKEFEIKSVMYLTYLTLYGKSIAKRDKDKLIQKFYHIVLDELPHSPYHLDN